MIVTTTHVERRVRRATSVYARLSMLEQLCQHLVISEASPSVV
jgi:hypothetical protein